MALDPAAVWAYVGDPERWPEWRAGVSDVRSEEPAAGATRARPEVAVGRRYRMALVILGQRMEMVLAVTNLVPGERLELQAVAGPIGGRTALVVAPAAAGARVSVSATAELSGPLAAAAAWIAPQVQQAWRDDLANLSRRLAKG